ncbi:MAG TPA: 2Fe-2S iron-sulfur cluster-binding protein [Thermoanaerobaculia bacterium]|nr:2Fe-2S iron-sulfur cluster-binding protein [Thermoanaerobaculia bacterium]
MPLQRTAEAKDNETILDVGRRAGAPIGNSCGAIGVCARCSVRVLSGAENLTPPTEIEARVAQRRKLDSDERLACQAVVLGNCEITTTYW